MARRLLVSALFASALGLVGCTPEYPKCKSDDHCKSVNPKEVCVQNECKECGQDSDCTTPGPVCKNYVCVPTPECTSNDQCQSGFKCKNEKCVPECSTDSECTAGLRCLGGKCTTAQCVSDGDCASGKRCEANQCVDAPVEVPTACSLDTVFFDFNEYSLTASARRVLDANADCLRSRSNSRITLAGHADERGTEEYNLHLGEKRANAVKKYLTTLGVEGSKLNTISYGEERPAARGADEGSWSQNRRVEFAD